MLFVPIYVMNVVNVFFSFFFIVVLLDNILCEKKQCMCILYMCIYILGILYLYTYIDVYFTMCVYTYIYIL